MLGLALFNALFTEVVNGPGKQPGRGNGGCEIGGEHHGYRLGLQKIAVLRAAVTSAAVTSPETAPWLLALLAALRSPYPTALAAGSALSALSVAVQGLYESGTSQGCGKVSTR
jgi:hypothetical protein